MWLHPEKHSLLYFIEKIKWLLLSIVKSNFEVNEGDEKAKRNGTNPDTTEFEKNFFVTPQNVASNLIF